ncbi:hypothetical protein FB45DRAFT_869933 [Roridomyces roridus]|uniref:Uncharacterized protein n=1 Tax=Roridomyces roridus TaxID=1738132 RepID=A0AAD7BJU5_9AGAR|nr:hypothetical protein FB45DRAFT_869933 [Roridomyces roridus]
MKFLTSCCDPTDLMQDLLKCIHHFACQYYSERGQLFNDTRTYRKERKRRRLAKLAAAEEAAQGEVSDGEENTVPDGQEHTVPDGQEHTVPDGEETTMPDGEENTSQDGQDNTSQDGEPDVPLPKKIRDPENRRRDMYKTLDGSALLAVGMLLQEHIGRILTATIPDGWEDGLEEDSDEEDSEEERATTQDDNGNNSCI